MSNHLNNGTVLPAGLLGVNNNAAMAAFNRVYKNTSLRVGIVIASYPTSDEGNHSKLSAEYDVLVFEQNENVSCTNIVYKNCLDRDGLGSIADFFEKTLRVKKKKTKKGETVNTSGQDGAVVLLQCLDGVSDKAIIISSLCHPDRKTKLKDDKPYLEGEYNGVNVKVDNDGAVSIIFKGATDNDGKVIDSEQKETTAKIEKDGSFQLDHPNISLRLDKDGTTTLKSKKDINLTTEGNINITVSKDAKIKVDGDVNLTASGNVNVEGSSIKLGKNASEAVVKGDAFKTWVTSHTHPTVVGPTGPVTEPFTPDLLSTKVKTE